MVDFRLSLFVHITYIASQTTPIHRPFLKWPGGKTRLVDRIRAHIPKNTRRLIEPFVGSGAVALNLNLPTNLLGDANADLIAVFDALRKNPRKFIATCARAFAPENNSATAYYCLRTEFNTTRDAERKTCLFVYLNRHGYNGLCRYNQSGGFNVPFGRHDRPYFPRAELLQFAMRLRQATFVHGDFRILLAEAGEGDFVYCDPPYSPASATARFSEYAPSGFSAADQRDLAECCRAAARRGARVLISNHDTAFTRKLYHDATWVISFPVPRTISSRADRRKPVQELLVGYMENRDRIVPCLANPASSVCRPRSA